MDEITPNSLFFAACLKEPEVRNAELAWDSDALYLLDAHVTATCNEGHLSDGGEASRVVTCTAYGWEAISGCYVACTAAPPPAGENMVMGQYNFTGVGASVQYECAQDFYVKRQGVGSPTFFFDLFTCYFGLSYIYYRMQMLTAILYV